MLFEQVYLLFIYILFIQLAIVTVIAIALFVALKVTMRKLDSKKNIINGMPHFVAAYLSIIIIRIKRIKVNNFLVL